LGHRVLQSAANFERLIPFVTVTDRHHPLYGKRLKLLSLTCARGPVLSPTLICISPPGFLRNASPASA
jgi:hypothetical protein